MESILKQLSDDDIPCIEGFPIIEWTKVIVIVIYVSAGRLTFAPVGSLFLDAEAADAISQGAKVNLPADTYNILHHRGAERRLSHWFPG